MTREPETPSLLQRRIYGTVGITLLVGLYLLVGLAGHDPWRGDDARYFGPILSMLNGEGWLFPMLAGEALADYPPLYYWTGALLAWASSSFLALHEGARLASAVFVALGVYFSARTAEALYGRPARTPGALLTMGSLGLVLHAHETQPLLALLAMIALTLRGLAQVPQRPLAGALLAGLGSALAFLATGLSGLLLTAPLFPLVMLLSSDCRNPRASGALLLGLCLALTLSALWPLAVHLHQPELLSLWLRAEWARFDGPPLSPGEITRGLELFGWFTWPLWPIALWSLWRGRRTLGDLRWLLPGLSALLMIALFVIAGDLSQAAALPILPAMALLAAGGVPSLRRGAANALDWFSLMSLAVFGILVWLAWSAQSAGWPPGLARHVARNAPDFVLPDPVFQAVLGAAISLVWIALLWKLPRSSSRAPANWAIGLTMLWCLAVVLLMPWFDNGRSYREAARSLEIAVAGERETSPGACIATAGLPGHVRSSLDYFSGLRTEPIVDDITPCPLLLVMNDEPPSTQLAPEWKTVWEFQRGAGRRAERFTLLRRELP
ncbi:ArnT family glycosyltransferase [Thauera linaloolentis]|uniref:Uncharacterized protein n=1 Tax=Thauera linaloolentis (strain DSM 12138 / JCM 21573 / CCUG 41526 / CIP 105981 / IAM 15112 / NBRC 102519 / 47Lol) TaxID=1123367 RepID=N6Z7I3_THAL4|nr:glycosyltransferase family 39 protein [Thauera linaloolentis]ENO88139.1 hypothetical protein C666_09415 [Thauera linaloolentis 47Lol = DSM 12138]MCM8565831.1 glycosyltransferase family 39 protein [Thauera linaloolentis]